MIDRDAASGPIIFRCDGCSHGFVETGAPLFNQAIAKAKTCGWSAVHCGAGQGWCHFCKDCSEGKVWEASGKRTGGAA